MRHPLRPLWSRPARVLPALLAALPAVAALAACDSGTLYRAGSENAPAGPGYWNGMECGWDDRLVAQSSPETADTRALEAPKLIAGDGDDALRAVAMAATEA